MLRTALLPPLLLLCSASGASAFLPAPTTLPALSPNGRSPRHPASTLAPRAAPLLAAKRPRAAPLCSMAASSASGAVYGLGFDFGTSGARINVVDGGSLAVVHAAERPYAEQTAGTWETAMDALIETIPADVRAKIGRVCVSGTSATALLVDAASRKVTRGPRMYDFSVADSPEGSRAMREIDRAAPKGHTTRSATSTLAKVLGWGLEERLAAGERVCHQADYLASRLLPSSAPFTSDWNNVLKLGYDVADVCYPEWLTSLLTANGVDPDALPRVVPPGGVMGVVSGEAAARYGFPKTCEVVGGTTDSIAAFIAARASKPGQAVTSLGSTVAIKLLSEVRVDDSDYGVYSHRLGDLWLVGGASNVGCQVLRQQGFSSDEIAQLSEKIDPKSAPKDGIRYYPLTKKGERFPVCDPQKEPVLEPVPDSRQDFLHGLLYGISEVERDGFKVLADMGATKVTEVLTAGGGSVNPMWRDMRAGMLGVPVLRAANSDAAFGVALLALGKHV